MAKQLGPTIRACYIKEGDTVLVTPDDGGNACGEATTVRGSRALTVDWIELGRVERRRVYVFHGKIDDREVQTQPFYGVNALRTPGPGYVDGPECPNDGAKLDGHGDQWACPKCGDEFAGEPLDWPDDGLETSASRNP